MTPLRGRVLSAVTQKPVAGALVQLLAQRYRSAGLADVTLQLDRKSVV